MCWEASSNILERASPITHVTKDDAPFVTLHGDKDTVAPLRVSEKLADFFDQHLR